MVAYQKLVLISILIGEKLSIKLPTFHTSIPHICRLYTNLLQVAADEDSDKFAATVAQMTPYLEKHNNLGLAKQVCGEPFLVYCYTGLVNCKIFSL